MATQDTNRQIAAASKPLGPRVIFALLVVLFVSLSGSIIFLVDDTKERLRESTYDRGGLSGTQIQSHYGRLMAALVKFEAGTPGVSLDTIVLEFDIVYERVKAHPTRPPNDQFNDQTFLDLAGRILATLELWVPAIDRIAKGDAAAITGLRPGLEPLRPDIDHLASTTIQLAAELREGVRRSNFQHAEQIVWLILGLALLSLVFVFMVWRQFMRAERQRVELLGLTANLREASAKAEAASNAKSEFLAHMSHELRTPLNSILGFSEIIRDGVLGKCEPVAYGDYAGNIHTSSRHLLGLIDGLLDLSRIDANKLDLEEEESSLTNHINWIISLTTDTCRRASVSIAVRESKAGIRVLADTRRLRQMLINLVDNAIKFSNPGGEIVVATEVTQQGDLVISVQDQGRGIPEEELAAVLEPFHRAQTIAYEATPGAGLGLSIVRSLVQSHGGSLHIDSDGVTGTTVHLCLPARRVLGQAP
jgi:signal transduction histidine kinase